MQSPTEFQTTDISREEAVSGPIVQGVVHTAIMTDLVRGRPLATPLLLALNKLGGPPFSRVTAIEMTRECQSDAERSLAPRFIGTSTTPDLTDAIARRAFDLLAASDAIVAATAIEHSLPLDTLDPARSAAVPGLATGKPY